MKTFIVFLALLLVLVSFLIWSSDLDRYMELQNCLKALAEECACGASLFTDRAAYAAGELKIDEKAARDYVSFIIENAESKAPLTGMDISASLSFTGDGTEVTLRCVSLSDLFRLPFLSLYEIERSAGYAWQ